MRSLTESMTESNTESIDLTLIETAEIMEKYGIASRATWGEWLKAARITSFKKGRKSYVYAYQLEVLDRLNQHMAKKGATLESFHPVNEWVNESATTLVEQQVEPPNQLNEYLVNIIAQLIKNSHEIPDPENNLLRLERIAKRGWWMRNHELAELIGISRIPHSPYEARGFKFIRKGRWWITVKSEVS